MKSRSSGAGMVCPMRQACPAGTSQGGRRPQGCLVRAISPERRGHPGPCEPGDVQGMADLSGRGLGSIHEQTRARVSPPLRGGLSDSHAGSGAGRGFESVPPDVYQNGWRHGAGQRGETDHICPAPGYSTITCLTVSLQNGIGNSPGSSVSTSNSSCSCIMPDCSGWTEPDPKLPQEDMPMRSSYG